MSIHCLICGRPDNCRKAKGGDVEVKVDNQTWVLLRIYRDNLLGEKVKKQRAIEEWWVHRDCMQKFLEKQCGVTSKLNYKPKEVDVS